MLSPDSRAHRARRQAETPLSVLCRIPEPALIDPNTDLPIYKAVPSSTYIASFWPKGKGFEIWLGNKGNEEAQEIKEAAGEKGSAFHKAIELINSGAEFRIDTKVPDYRKSTEQEAVHRELTFEELLCVWSYLDWRKEIELDHSVEVLVSEENVYSDMYDFAGTVDAVYRFTPKPEGKNPLKLGGPTNFIVDYKTSKSVHRSHKIQISSHHRTITNGENVFPIRNANGTETGENHDLRICNIAILQLGYSLKRPLTAQGDWVSKRVFFYEMRLTQAGRAIHELENKFGWMIKHSPANSRCYERTHH